MSKDEDTQCTSQTVGNLPYHPDISLGLAQSTPEHLQMEMRPVDLPSQLQMGMCSYATPNRLKMGISLSSLVPHQTTTSWHSTNHNHSAEALSIGSSQKFFKKIFGVVGTMFRVIVSKIVQCLTAVVIPVKITRCVAPRVDIPPKYLFWQGA